MILSVQVSGVEGFRGFHWVACFSPVSGELVTKSVTIATTAERRNPIPPGDIDPGLGRRTYGRSQMAGSGTRSSVSTLAVHRSITNYDRRQRLRRSVRRNAPAVVPVPCAACWSLICITSSTCRTTLRVEHATLRGSWAISSGRAPPARSVIRGCLRCRVGADRPIDAALGG